MKSDGLAVQIRLSGKGKKTLRLLKQWPKRTERIRRLIPYLASKYVHQKILEKIPNEADWTAYRSSLETVKVSGVGKGISAHALRAAPRSRRVRDSDIKLTVLYVQPTKRPSRVKPEIEILKKYSPWTAETLPFLPKKSEALVVSRKVSKRVRSNVAKAREKDRPEWRKELTRVGRPEDKKTKLDLPPRISAVPDVALDALRLEFGYRGAKSVPHWKPAIRELMANGVRSLFRTDRRIIQTFQDLRFKAWKRWPPSVSQTIGLPEARKYVPFQNKLGIRARL
jgi:hypothetical protein